MTPYPAAWMVLLCGFYRPAYATPPVLVWATSAGAHFADGTFTGAWTPYPERASIAAGSATVQQQWCTADRTYCEDDTGWPGFDADWHVTYVDSTGCAVAAIVPIEFHSIDLFGHTQSGCWGGYADFNLDGAVNSTDFFDYLGAFFNADPRADYNNDGAINSQDYFDFLACFTGGCPQ